jgi:hypothetical protein
VGAATWCGWKENPTTRLTFPSIAVGIDYFETLQTPLQSGREFNAHDDLSAPKVAIINETFARRLQEGNPVGRRVVVEATPNEPETTYEIVGVARDAKFEDLKETSPGGDVPAQPARSAAFGEQTIPDSFEAAASGDHRSVNRALNEVSPSLDTTVRVVPDDGPGTRCCVTFDGDAVGLLWRAGAGARDDRSLRNSFVRSGQQDERDWHSHGARREHAGSGEVDSARSADYWWQSELLPAAGCVRVARFAESVVVRSVATDPLSLVLAGAMMLAVAIIAAYLPARARCGSIRLVALAYEMKGHPQITQK